MAGSFGSIRAPRPSSISSKPGWTLVPPGAKRERISLTASTASISARTDSSIQVSPALRPSSSGGPGSGPSAGPSTKRVLHPIEHPVGPGDRFAGRGRQLLQELALLLVELGGDGDLDEDMELSLIHISEPTR